MGIRVSNEITCYELGREKVVDCPQLKVKSHWNDSDLVVIDFPGMEKSVTVLGRALKKAIDNAMNSGDY